jgi:hypothetical protein
MNFNEVIAELPRLTFSERQILIRRALELDDPALSAADEELVEEGLEAHRADPSSSLPLDEMKRRLRAPIKYRSRYGTASGSERVKGATS